MKALVFSRRLLSHGIGPSPWVDLRQHIGEMFLTQMLFIFVNEIALAGDPRPAGIKQ